MPIPTSKPLSMSAIQTEYGGTNPISLSEYYSKGNAPASGAITVWGDFNGTSNIVTETNTDVDYNWYGNSIFTIEDTAETATMINTAADYRPDLSSYYLYSYIDAGPGWLGATVDSFSNIRIESKLVQYYDSDGSVIDPPNYAVAQSTVIYTAVDASGVTIAQLGTDSVNQASSGNTLTRDVITNAQITAAMTDAQIKTWISSGCHLRHRYLDDDDTNGTGSATVDTPKVFVVTVKADSITYFT